MKHKALNQLLCAATINGRFRDVLLRNPAQALSSGYLDHTFALTPEESQLVLGIQAKGLEDFAAQVYNWIQGNGQSRYGDNGSVRRDVGTSLVEPVAEFYRSSAPVHA